MEAQSGGMNFCYRSLSFTILVQNLLLPDFSSLKSSSLFGMIYNELPHRSYLQCKIKCPPTELYKTLLLKNEAALCINQIDESKSGDQVFRYAIQSCTWFGDRVLAMIRGIYNQKMKGPQAIRAEIRCSHYKDLVLIKKQIDVFL